MIWLYLKIELIHVLLHHIFLSIFFVTFFSQIMPHCEALLLAAIILSFNVYHFISLHLVLLFHK